MNALILIYLLMLISKGVHGYTETGCTGYPSQTYNSHIILCNHGLQGFEEEIEICEYISGLNCIVDVKNINDHDFSRTLDAKYFITSIKISDSNITFVPDELYFCRVVENIEISNSKEITKINVNRFLDLPYLNSINISHNNIAYLETEIVTRTNKNIVTIDLSHNLIADIPNNCFRYFTYLKYLDLSHNSLSVLETFAFEGLTELTTLRLSNNNILKTGLDIVAIKNIQELTLDNNQITELQEHNFVSLHNLRRLNVSINRIQNIEELSFNELPQIDSFRVFNSSLLCLNLSSNSIQHISKTAFTSLSNLTKLDLSINNITHLDFETKDLKQLSILNISHNNIKNITTKSLIHLSSLVELDLSFNSLSELEPRSFENLVNLKRLTINNNYLNHMKANTFKGLIRLERIELFNTTSTSYHNESFSGMVSLKFVNSSFGHISYVGYNAFLNTGKIEILDLSYNLLNEFEINTTTVANVKELYLNNNQLAMIKNSTFQKLSSLQKLDLSHNNIAIADSLAFQYLSNLIFLNLSSNSNNRIADRFSENTDVSQKFLVQAKNSFQFHNANTSIEILKLSSCEITDINNVFVYNVKGLRVLDLNSNKITFVDEFSFQNMPSLILLDLSSNLIKYIQPGSFLGTKYLNVLRLEYNSINTIPFGAFNGLDYLKTLNLSNNYIETFNPRLLHNTPSIQSIFLDNNALTEINLSHFNMAAIKTLSVGGNLISCDILAEVKMERNINFEVTAKNKNYFIENVDGISCVSSNGEQTFHEVTAQ